MSNLSPESPQVRKHASIQDALDSILPDERMFISIEKYLDLDDENEALKHDYDMVDAEFEKLLAQRRDLHLQIAKLHEEIASLNVKLSESFTREEHVVNI